jgi:excisionase family DNA binding protein
MPHRVFDVDEVAAYLHLKRADIERLLKKQDIPCEKRAGRVVFRRSEIDAWASQRILGLEEERLTEYHRKTSNSMQEQEGRDMAVLDLLKPGRVRADLPARTKASVLREMTGLAHSSGLVNDPKALLAQLQAREDLCSTGISGGMAILHPRHHDPYLFSEPLLALGRTVQAIPFGAPDGRASRFFFLLGCPDDRLHLHVMARLCLLAHKTNLLFELAQAPDADALWQAVADAEAEVSVKPA